MTAEAEATATTVMIEPGVGASYGNGWKRMWKYFLELLVIAIIVWVLSLPFSIIQWTIGSNGALVFLGTAYSLFIMGPVGFGMTYAYLRVARGEAVEIQDIFAAFKNYWNAVGAYILTAIIVGIGFFLLIIPGIIFACKLAFVPYLIVDRKMDVIEAIKTSWNMTNGHAGTVFLIGLLAIPIIIAGAICFGVGIIIASMWISMAFASMYHAVSLRKTPAVTSP